MLTNWLRAYDHLRRAPKVSLGQILKNYAPLFESGLGTVDKVSVSLEIDVSSPTYKTYSGRVYPIPQILHRTPKEELTVSHK